MDQYTRPLKPFTPIAESENDKLDYTAGMIDTDGTIGTNLDASCGSISLCLSVTQAVRGWAVLGFLYETFGGVIGKHCDATETAQASYVWRLTGNESIVSFLRLIEKRLTVKRREALLALEFPVQNVKVIPIRVTNLHTNETHLFQNAKEVACFFGHKRLEIKPSGKRIIKNTWKVERILDESAREDIKQKRIEIRNGLKQFHKQEHDEIPDSFILTNAYLAGVVDGDGCFDTHGKTSQHHKVTQKDPPLLKLIQRKYGGCINKTHDNYDLSIYTCDGADKLLQDIAPYIIGKQKQVSLIQNMKPGEADAIHSQLRELKGNYNHHTRKIDNTSGKSKEYKLPPKELPRGVHRLPSGNYCVYLGVNKRNYCLGTFGTIQEAQAQYEKYKEFAQKEKRTNEHIVDWSQFSMEKKLKTSQLPKPDSQGEKNIYCTPYHTYQVKVRGVAYGTFNTLDEAIKVRNEIIERVKKEDFEAKLAGRDSIYPRQSKKSGLVYDVKIGGQSYGAYTTEEEAMQVRNKILIEQHKYIEA